MQFANSYNLSVVVPCYNEEETLSVFYKEVLKHIYSFMETGKLKGYEFVFVDDGSTDATASLLQDFACRDDNVRYLILSRNFGKEAAIFAGLQKTTGTYVVIMDADSQDPPALIPQMLEVVSCGEFDCAATRRVTRKGEPPIRSFFARKKAAA